jgi:hypothetical protein
MFVTYTGSFWPWGFMMTDHTAKSPGNPGGFRGTVAQAAPSELLGDLFRAAALRWGVLLSTGYLLLWGAAALIARFATGVDSAKWWWGAAGLAGVWGIACLLGWRQRPSAEQARAVVDSRGRLGGVLMAQDMDGFDAWVHRVCVPPALRVRWRGGQACGALALSSVFVLGALLAPMPRWDGAAAGMNVQRTIDSLEDQVQMLEEERILDEPEAQTLREDMARIGEDALGADPSRTWEALDHLADRLDQTAAEAADEALRQMSDSAAAESLAQALNNSAGQLSEQQMSAAMQALSELTKQAVGNDLSAGLPPEMAEALTQAAAAGLDPETLAQLAEMLNGRQGDLQAMLDALESAKLIQGRLSDMPVDYDPDALLEWLETQGEGECDAAAIAKACKAGRGGITRGPGHTEMIWKDPSSKEDASFDPQVLPPSRLRDLDDARLLGVTRAAPDTEPDSEGSTGGALGGASTTGGSAQTATILPRHRAAVQRYFQRSVPDNEDQAPPAPGDTPALENTPTNPGASAPPEPPAP